jgi:hypothetical protein
MIPVRYPARLTAVRTSAAPSMNRQSAKALSIQSATSDSLEPHIGNSVDNVPEYDAARRVAAFSSSMNRVRYAAATSGASPKRFAEPTRYESIVARRSRSVSSRSKMIASTLERARRGTRAAEEREMDRSRSRRAKHIRRRAEATSCRRASHCRPSPPPGAASPLTTRQR